MGCQCCKELFRRKKAKRIQEDSKTVTKITGEMETDGGEQDPNQSRQPLLNEDSIIEVPSTDRSAQKIAKKEGFEGEGQEDGAQEVENNQEETRPDEEVGAGGEKDSANNQVQENNREEHGVIPQSIGNESEGKDNNQTEEEERQQADLERDQVKQTVGDTLVDPEAEWEDIIPALFDDFEVEQRLQSWESKYKAMKADKKMKVCLDPKKEAFNSSLRAKIKKDKVTKLRTHDYLMELTLPISAKFFVYFNLFQSIKSRKYINEKVTKYGVEAAIWYKDMLCVIIHTLTEGALMLKGQEVLYLMCYKFYGEDAEGKKIRIAEVSGSIEHPKIPPTSGYNRLNMDDSTSEYVFNIESGTCNIVQHTKIITKLPVGLMLLKPFLSGYQRAYYKKTVEEMTKLLGGDLKNFNKQKEIIEKWESEKLGNAKPE